MTANLDDHRLAQRLKEAESWIANNTMPGPSSGPAHGRAIKATTKSTAPVGVGILTMATVVVVAIIVLRAWPANERASALPEGLFVPNQPIEMCVAIELERDSLARGEASIYWWSIASPDCSDRNSGITHLPADITPVSLRGVEGLPPRTGYEVSFVVGVIPSGTDEISFTLDPEYARRKGLPLVAARDDEVLPSVTFRRVVKLSIPGPGDSGPVPTPRAPSPAP